jgi:hypothetical protein
MKAGSPAAVLLLVAVLIAAAHPHWLTIPAAIVLVMVGLGIAATPKRG